MAAQISPSAASLASSSSVSHSLFFYGTLVHPAILARIVGQVGAANVYVQPAILPGFACQHVEGADYPALVPEGTPAGKSSTAFVRGTLVRGLSIVHLQLLDHFEGDDYTRDVVSVLYNPQEAPVRNDLRPSKDVQALLGILQSLDDETVHKMLSAASQKAADEGGNVKEEQTQTYIWTSKTHHLDLSRGPWKFEEFVASKAHRWTGKGLTEELEETEKAGKQAAAEVAKEEDGAHAAEEYRAVDEERERILAGATQSSGTPVLQDSTENHASFLGDTGRTSSSTLVSMPIGDDPWAASAANASISAAKTSTKSREEGSAAGTTSSASALAAENPWANDEEERKEAEREAAAFKAALAIGKDSEARPQKRDALPLAGAASSAAAQDGLTASVPLTASPIPANGSASAPWDSRAATPPVTSLQGAPAFGQEKFGHSLKKYWGHAPGYVNLNNGSYGACPKPVRKAYNELQDLSDEIPDLFRRETIYEHLRRARESLAPILNVPADSIALIPNATTASNSVLRDYMWQPGDCILVLSTVYGAVERTLAWLRDHHPSQPEVITVEITLPCSHDETVAAVQKKLDEMRNQGQLAKVKMAIIDSISSKPGVRMPWERLCKIFKSNQILTFVDAAHGIGAIDMDVGEADPDFLVSNCHKWMYAPRSCAVFYVAPRNRHIATSSLPTSHSYVSKVDPQKNTWLPQWEAPGTFDFVNMITVNAALDFRKKLGGERRIIDYNLSLARQGGAAAAKILGTDTMDTEKGELTACMANVRLPLLPGTWKPNFEWMKSGGMNDWFEETLLRQFKTTIPLFEHDRKLWARFSAQIWLEINDFEYGARALLELCRRINEGEVSFP